MNDVAAGQVLLTGATGFVGGNLYPVLRALGFRIRCATRDPARALRHWPGRDWVRMSVNDPDSVRAALRDCSAAFYLVHGMHEGAEYPQRDERAARAFAEAASREGLSRIVYLGGIRPEARPSRHLASRIRVGEVLRAGSANTVELRTAMIIGEGSASWRIVRDLAARLPAMALPRWLAFHSWPVDIADVAIALVKAATIDVDASRIFDVPGPERLSHRQTLECAAGLMGKHPRIINVPVVSPGLSSYWIALVTRSSLHMARELVAGLQSDLDPSQCILWDDSPSSVPKVTVREAMVHALAEEKRRVLWGPSMQEQRRVVDHVRAGLGSDA